MSKQESIADQIAAKSWDETGKAGSAMEQLSKKSAPSVEEAVSIPKVAQTQSVTQLAQNVQLLEASTIEMNDRSDAKSTQASESLKRNKMALQANINAAAKRFSTVYRPSAVNELVQHNNELVMIQAMHTHHPGPTIGSFSFADIYGNYVKGMKYLVPRFAALSLEENDNAVILS